MKSTESLYVELSGVGVGGVAATTTNRLARSLICDGFSDNSFAPVSPLRILVESASALLPSSLAATARARISPARWYVVLSAGNSMSAVTSWVTSDSTSWR